ncbi:MAG TPA: NAD/NADP octopine/nopaline dehydrogenase family protein [Candidatus Dormibacteraeota bacterium]
MKIAVVGGGHGALATAADMALHGHEVRLSLRNRARFATVFETGEIALSGVAGDGVGRLAEVTDDPAAAARGADLVLVPMPATAQAEVAERLRGGALVCLLPGTFGAYPVGRRLGSPVAETATLPYGARFQGGNAVRIAMRAHNLPTGVYPARDTDAAVRLLAGAYPQVEAVEDALSAGLLNSNGALHAPLVLMNAGPIERLGEYDIHVEGTTPRIRRLIEDLDAERISLRRALGYTSADWPLADYYADADWFYGPGAFSTVQRKSVWREPLGFEHRYLLEDVGFGLVLWSSLGRALGVPTPLGDACIALASSLLERDLRRHGRSLENLGLDGLDAAGLRARL